MFLMIRSQRTSNKQPIFLPEYKCFMINDYCQKALQNSIGSQFMT